MPKSILNPPSRRDAMPDLKTEYAAAKGWATLHVIAACGICAAVGFVLGMFVG